MFNRRRLMQMSVGAGAFSLIGCKPSLPTELNPSNLSSEEEFRCYIKTIGSLETSDVYVWFKGVLWGAIPRNEPVPICGFQGLARHRWTANPDGSFVQKAYDVGFFSDLETDAPTQFMTNPMTGEKVEVYHNKYGGFEQLHSVEKFTSSKPGQSSKQDELSWSKAEDTVILTERSTGQIRSKMQPEAWPRETSGPINYYGGETSYSTSLKELSDPNVKSADYSMFWSSFSPWEPWLHMDGAKGVCQWRATGIKLSNYTDAPQTILDFVSQDQPNYFGPDDPWEGYRSSTDAFMRDRKPAEK